MIQYLDNYEIENVGPASINLAQSFASFENVKKDEEMILQALIEADESNFEAKSHYVTNLNFELTSMRNNRPNYALLHPIAAYGIVTAMGQFINGNQPCRTAYAAKHTTQDIETIMNNPYANVNRLTAFYSTRSRVRSFVHEAMGLTQEAHGQSLVVCFVPQYKNQEDSCIISKSAVDNGKLSFNNTIIISETLQQDDERFGRFTNGAVSSYRYRLINESGFPTVGMFANPEDVIISRIKSVVGGTDVPMLTKLDKNEYGYVEEVVISRITKTSNSANHQLMVNVRLNSHTCSVAGNKIRTPHAQKFIASEFRAAVDMIFFPYLNGLRADVMMSTHCIPTRMTMGSLLEPLFQFISVLEGREFDTSGFRSYSIVELRNILRRHGFRDDGTHWAIDGRTGRKFKVPLFVGPARVHMLARIAEDQVQCRTIGNRNKTTGQAESARSGDSRDKGQKFGEMERIQAIKYGASFLIAERMNASCDQVPVVVCKDCSAYAKFNGALGKFSCPNCGIAAEGRQCRDQFGQFMHSQSAIYLELLAQSMGIEIKTRYGTAKDLMNAAVNEESNDDDSRTRSSEELDENDSDEDWI
jgi:DNA-directed RNA polymerase beta subunit